MNICSAKLHLYSSRTFPGTHPGCRIVFTLLLATLAASFLPRCVHAAPGPLAAAYLGVPLSGYGRTGAVADLNRDGVPDLVAATQQDSVVSVLLGNGDGSFLQRTDIPLPGNGIALAVADLNGDQVPDLVVGLSRSFSYESIAIFLGNGDGTFQPMILAQSPANVPTIAVGDLNGDGHPDLVVPSRVMLGLGDGRFSPPIEIAGGLGGSDLALADLDEDGKLDLVAAIMVPDSTGTLALALGNGDGTFKIPQYLTTPHEYAWTVVVGDLNLDGHADLVVSSNQGGGILTVFTGHGDGTFSDRRDFPSFQLPVDLVLGDVNGDGRPDLAVADLFGSSVGVLLGDGTGGFTSNVGYRTGASPWTVAIADFDRDGTPDLALRIESEGEFCVHFGNGDGTFGQAPAPFAAARMQYAAATADVDGDSRVDVLATETQDNGVMVFAGHGDGTFAPPVRYAVGNGPSTLAVADIDGDGAVDLATGNASSNDVTVLRNDGHGGFGRRADYALAGSSARALALVDVSGDGRPDLLAITHDPGALEVRLGDGTGLFGPATAYPASPGAMAFAIADFNLDGHPDVATLAYSDSSFAVLLGVGEGTFQPAVHHAKAQELSFLAAGDVNGDGMQDLVITDVDTGTAQIMLGDGHGSFVAGASVVVGLRPTAPRVCDMTGDGRMDIVTVDGSGAIAVTPQRPDGSFDPPRLFGTTTAAGGLAVGDFNNDARPDVVVSGGQYEAWLAVLLNVAASSSTPVITASAGPGGTIGPAGSVAVCCNGNASFAIRPDAGYQIVAVLVDGVPVGAVAGYTFASVTTNHTISASFSGIATGTLLSLFQVEPVQGAVELRWQFGDPGSVVGTVVERGEAEVGPWVPVTGDTHREGEVMVAVDRDVVPGATYYYRLSSRLAGGGRYVSGAMRVIAGEVVSSSDLAYVGPNPGSGPVRIEYTVARETAVSLRIVDLQGRLVASLVRGVFRPGRYQATWSGELVHGRASSGVYFVRYQAGGRSVVRRFVLAR